MKKAIAILLALSLVLTFTSPAFAARGGRKGASDQALEKASDEAVFHRVGDWFATVGKSEEEKQQIMAERKAERAARRAQKQLEKEKKRLEKEKRKLERKSRKLEKGLSD